VDIRLDTLKIRLGLVVFARRRKDDLNIKLRHKIIHCSYLSYIANNNNINNSSYDNNVKRDKYFY